MIYKLHKNVFIENDPNNWVVKESYISNKTKKQRKKLLDTIQV